MADIPLYDGETITLHWGTLAWVCQVYRSDDRCVRCGGATVRLNPPWETWTFLCCAESVLTITHAKHQAAINSLAPGAIGMVSAIPVQVEKADSRALSQICLFEAKSENRILKSQ
jgi:hypothetical protein